jgi:hypothetical protein
VSPATGQIGLIGSNWSRGWIIEDCEISHAACAGITLGKYNDPEDFGDRPVADLPYETPAGDVFRFECDIAGRHRPPGPTLAGSFAGDPAGICLSTLAGPTSL